MRRAFLVVRINTCSNTCGYLRHSHLRDLRTPPVRQTITVLCLVVRCELLRSHHTSLARFISTGTLFSRVRRQTSVSYYLLYQRSAMMLFAANSAICSFIDRVQLEKPFTSHFTHTNPQFPSAVSKMLPMGMQILPSQKRSPKVLPTCQIPHAGPQGRSCDER